MANNYPILLFPTRVKESRSKLHSGPNKLHFPPHDRQKQRFGPIFSALQNALENKRFQLLNGPEGLDPEEVLVLEIAGDVTDFIKAVNKVDGMEWLGEVDIDSLSPDEDFYDTENNDKTFGGKLFLTASNSTAMNQLLSLWNMYSEDAKAKFPRGQSNMRHVFEQLKSVRFWGIQDRLYKEDAELWLQCIEQYPERPIRFEVELWFRTSTDKRHAAESTVSAIVSEVGGKIISRCEIEEIRYHSVLAEVPAIRMREILQNVEGNDLIKNNNVMTFRPSGQQVSSFDASDNVFTGSYKPVNLRDRNPRVAIFDGMPMENHVALTSVLHVDDPDDFASSYSVANRCHGTEMCSLIARGDLMNDAPIATPIYLRPIMKPDKENNEFIPDNILLVDLIHRSVKRMFESESGNPPAAPMVKVINFSIGDPNRVFYNSISPMARLLDWLSCKYNVLFLISAGNTQLPFVTDNASEFNSSDSLKKSQTIFSTIIKSRGESRLISPAESINNITVGALHYDNSILRVGDRRLNPYEMMMPAIYTRLGGGHKKSVKPDLVYWGGRQMYQEVIASNISIPTSINHTEPGLLVAAPDPTRTKAHYNRGTSHATALMSHNAAYCIDVIERMNVNDSLKGVLLKAMLVHGCSWDNIEDNINSCIGDMVAKDEKRIVTQMIGYGIPDFDKATACNPQCATVAAVDEISPEEGHIYEFPLPPSLASKTEERRLTITLAWFTPINAASQKYRSTKLWFETPDKMSDKRYGPDWQKVKNGTLQHEVFIGDTAQAFVDGDSIRIKISCADDATAKSNPVKYALMVSLEVKQGLSYPIYQEVAERIMLKVPITQN